MIIYLTGILCCLLTLLFWIKWKLPSNYPPTPPIRLPFIGHAHYLRGYKNFQAGFDEVFKKYNKNGILCLHVGANIKMVMMSDYETIKTSFKSEDLNYRLAHDFSVNYCKQIYGGLGVDGVLWSYGSNWSEQRRFLISTLKDFGLGKSVMDEIILEEASTFSTYLGTKNGKPLSIANFFNIGILNVLWRIVGGSRYEYDDPELKNLVAKVGDAILATNLKPSIGAIFPILRKIYPNIDHTPDSTKKIGTVYDFLKKAIRERKATFDPEKIEDFIDAYLLKASTSPKGSGFEGELGELNLSKVLLDLFFAGSETTSSTLSWGVLYMIRNPKIQKRVRVELESVLVGKPVSKNDWNSLPYTEAVISEIQRMGNIVPMGVPHATYKKGVNIQGYSVPKGHVVSAHLTSVFSNPEYFGSEPEKFKPERFLDESGKYSKNKHLIPFLIGKRSCPGENLAKMEIWTFFTSLIQKFNIETGTPGVLPSEESVSGITSVPLPFTVSLTPIKLKPLMHG